jgi:hypothetical protein
VLDSKTTPLRLSFSRLTAFKERNSPAASLPTLRNGMSPYIGFVSVRSLSDEAAPSVQVETSPTLSAHFGIEPDTSSFKERICYAGEDVGARLVSGIVGVLRGYQVQHSNCDHGGLFASLTQPAGCFETKCFRLSMRGLPCEKCSH